MQFSVAFRCLNIRHGKYQFTGPNTIKCRPIKAQIQTNTSTNIDQCIHHFFNTCTSTCQYRHWYSQIRLPHQHCLHCQQPLLLLCQRYLSLPSNTHLWPQDQPCTLVSLVSCQTAHLYFVAAKLSTLKLWPRFHLKQADSGGGEWTAKSNTEFKYF